eukprot:COSAG06_NODE_642_length_13482_cov_21.927296_7_plen_243_part_00
MAQVRQRVFLRHLILKMIMLPRQARDKHRESTQKETRVFLISLVRYQANLIANAESGPNSTQHEGLAACDQFKDWLCGNAQSCCTHPSAKGAPEPSNCRVGAEMGGFSYVLGLRAMSGMATVLGHSSAAAQYSQLASKATAEFHSYFFNSSVGRYGGDIGAIQSLSLPALKIDSPPASLYPNVVSTVKDDLVAINYTLAVGAVTSKILFNVLSENGEETVSFPPLPPPPPIKNNHFAKTGSG